jgi:hypothetical protein
MDIKTQAKYDARARILKAMAHPTRLFIVDELAKNAERCVCELAEMVGADMSTVSCLYSSEGVWVQSEGDNVRVGLTDYVQQPNGDVAFFVLAGVYFSLRYVFQAFFAIMDRGRLGRI